MVGETDNNSNLVLPVKWDDDGMTQRIHGMIQKSGGDAESFFYETMIFERQRMASFLENRIFPDYRLIEDFYFSMQDIIDEREKNLARRRKIKSIDYKKLTFDYFSQDDDPILEAIALSWEKARPLLQKTHDFGQNIAHRVSENLVVIPLGLVAPDSPLYSAGYFVIPHQRELVVFEYKLRSAKEISIEKPELPIVPYLALSMNELGRFEVAPLLGIESSARQIRDSLYRTAAGYNPVWFFADISDTLLNYPFAETLLPIAKRKLVKEATRHLGTDAETVH